MGAILLGHLVRLGLFHTLDHMWHDCPKFLDLLFLCLLQGSDRPPHQPLVDTPASLFSSSSTLHLEGEILEELVHSLPVLAVYQLEPLDQVLPQQPVDLHILFTAMLILLIGQANPVSNLRLRHTEVFTEGLKPVELTFSIDDPRHGQGIIQLSLDLDAKDFLQDRDVEAADVMPN